MYKSIYDYAKKNNIVPRRNRVTRKISGYIVLDAVGKYQMIEISDKKAECPDIGSLQYGDCSQPICEKFEKMFWYKTETEEFGKEKQFDNWISIMKDGAANVDILKPIYTFVEKIKNNKEYCKFIVGEITAANIRPEGYLSYRVESSYIEQDVSWEEWFDNYIKSKKKKEDTQKLVSCITGDLVKPVIDSVPIKGPSELGSGVYVSSFKRDAYTSYGFKKGDNRNAAMSEDEALTISAGINSLLSSEHNHSSKFNILYWYENNENNENDLISNMMHIDFGNLGDSVNDKEAAKLHEIDYKETLNAVFQKDEKSTIRDDATYHLMRYSIPVRGRLLLSDERTGSLKELDKNLRCWYKDAKIEWVYGDKKVTKTLENIYGIAFSLLYRPNTSDKFKELKNEYGRSITDLLFSIFDNSQIPDIFYKHAITIATKAIMLNGRKSNDDTTAHWPLRVPIQIIKVHLIRKGIYMDEKLNTGIKETGYLLGRWFAVLEKIQEDAAYQSGNKISLTIANKYYRDAKLNPQRVFNRCNDLVRTAYLRKMSAGSKVYYEKLLGEIVGGLGSGKDAIPKTLSIDQCGAFDIGYIQQRSNLYAKHKENKDNNVRNEEEI